MNYRILSFCLCTLIIGLASKIAQTSLSDWIIMFIAIYISGRIESYFTLLQVKKNMKKPNNSDPL